MRKLLTAAILCSLVTSSLLNDSNATEKSKESNLNEAYTCSKVEDNLLRLNCYDRLFKVTMNRQSDSQQSDNEKSQAKESNETAFEAPLPPLPPKTGAPSKKSNLVDAEKMFGLEAQATELTVESIESRVLGNFADWEKGLIITLQNGQKWELINPRKMFYKASNPTVKIEKGSFGSFFLVFPDRNRKIRIRRVE